jgi:hypothetical protein
VRELTRTKTASLAAVSRLLLPLVLVGSFGGYTAGRWCLADATDEIVGEWRLDDRTSAWYQTWSPRPAEQVALPEVIVFRADRSFNAYFPDTALSARQRDDFRDPIPVGWVSGHWSATRNCPPLFLPTRHLVVEPPFPRLRITDNQGFSVARGRLTFHRCCSEARYNGSYQRSSSPPDHAAETGRTNALQRDRQGQRGFVGPALRAYSGSTSAEGGLLVGGP